MPIKISIIVTTYNRGDILNHCLDCLAAQTLDKSDYEVLIINNNSTDNTQSVAETYAKNNQNFKVFIEEKQGSAHARNRGWAEAKGEIIAYIDDDAKTTADWAEKIIKNFESVNPKPVAVGGQVFPWYEDTPPKWFTDEFEIRTWGKESRFLKKNESFVTMNTAVLRSMFEKYGGFNPEYGPIFDTPRMGDDTEFFYRIYEKEPYLWYDPGLTVYHWTPKSRMKASYRFKRAVKNGEALAAMRNRKFFSFSYAKYFAGLIYSLAKFPFAVIFSKNKLTSSVSELEKIGYLVGYLKF